MADYVKMVSAKGNSVLVAETDVEEFEAKGFTVEDAKADAPSDDNDAPVTSSSRDAIVKIAADVISGLQTIDAVVAYVEGDERVGVIEAAEKRTEEIEGE